MCVCVHILYIHFIMFHRLSDLTIKVDRERAQFEARNIKFFYYLIMPWTFMYTLCIYFLHCKQKKCNDSCLEWNKCGVWLCFAHATCLKNWPTAGSYLCAQLSMKIFTPFFRICLEFIISNSVQFGLLKDLTVGKNQKFFISPILNCERPNQIHLNMCNEPIAKNTLNRLEDNFNGFISCDFI